MSTSTPTNNFAVIFQAGLGSGRAVFREHHFRRADISGQRPYRSGSALAVWRTHRQEPGLDEGAAVLPDLPRRGRRSWTTFPFWSGSTTPVDQLEDDIIDKGGLQVHSTVSTT